MSRTNTQIVLANRPPNDGAIDPKLGATFEKRSVPVPTQLPADSVLIEVSLVPRTAGKASRADVRARSSTSRATRRCAAGCAMRAPTCRPCRSAR